MQKRVLTLTVWATALSLVFAATTGELRAVDCDPEVWSPARCVPAHADPPEQTSGGSWCYVDMSGDCVRAAGSQCVDKYGTAVPGVCDPYAGYSNPTQCTEDYGVTVVEVDRYKAACCFVAGVCQCKFTLDTSASPALIEVCQCSESAL